MTAEHTVSASQLELLQLCGWRWYYTYIEDRREPFAESAQAGTLVHDRIEKHLLGEKHVNFVEIWIAPSGYVYEIGEIAKAMLANIPWGFGELTKEHIETKLRLVVEDIVFTGRVDLKVTNQVWDQKTTSNLKYAKSKEQLSTDIQALVYAKWALDFPAEPAQVDLTWNYGQSKGETNTKKVHLTLLRDEIEERFENIVMPLAREAQAAYIHRDKHKLKRNDRACYKFPPNGCPHKIRCTIAFNMTKINLLDSLRASVGEPAPQDPIKSPESQTVTTEQVQKVLEEVLPKKERKKKSPDAATTAAVAAPANDTASPQAEPDLDPKPINTLFVQAMPLDNRPLVYAHVLIAQASRTVENDLQLHHVRLAPYNTGGASLAAQLRMDILEMQPGFDLVLMNRTPEGREVEAVLAGMAKTVIVGV